MCMCRAKVQSAVSRCAEVAGQGSALNQPADWRGGYQGRGMACSCIDYIQRHIPPVDEFAVALEVAAGHAGPELVVVGLHGVERDEAELCNWGRLEDRRAGRTASEQALRNRQHRCL